MSPSHPGTGICVTASPVGAKTLIRALPVSATYTLPSDPIAMPTGSISFPGSEP